MMYSLFMNANEIARKMERIELANLKKNISKVAENMRPSVERRIAEIEAKHKKPIKSVKIRLHWENI